MEAAKRAQKGMMRLKNDSVNETGQVKLNEIGNESISDVEKFNMFRIKICTTFESFIELASGPTKMHIINNGLKNALMEWIFF